MLILTKQEVCERISCFEKMIDVYNKKVEFLQKLLVYFEKTGRNLDCLVLNVCVQGIQEDIFSAEDHIHIVKEESKVIDNQENHVSFLSYPLSVVNTIMPKTILSTKSAISSDTITKNVNGSHLRHNTAVTKILPVITQKSDSKLSNSLLSFLTEDTSTIPLVVPKLESIAMSKYEVEQMDTTSCQIKETDMITSFVPTTTFQRQASTTHFSPSAQRSKANIFLSASDVDTADMSMTLSIKDVKSLNYNIEKQKDVKVKQFQCEICTSAFAQKGVLNRHRILRHSPVVNKPYICPNCRKAFTLKHHLKNHLKCKSGCRLSNDLSV